MCSLRNDNIHTYSIYLVFIIAKHLILLMPSPFLRKKKEKAKKTKQNKKPTNKNKKTKKKNKKEKQKEIQSKSKQLKKNPKTIFKNENKEIIPCKSVNHLFCIFFLNIIHFMNP